MPRISGLLESSLYVGDVARSVRFYREVLGFEPLDGGSLGADPAPRFAALLVPGRAVLLLFEKGGCRAPATLPGGTIPPHDCDGRLHLAFAVAAAELAPWRERLRSLGVGVEGEMGWGRGGTSLYFRDPDGHLLELATPGVWSAY